MKTVASKKTKTLWEKWYETIKEEEQLQSNMDVTVQCVDFCEVTTSYVYAVLRHAPADLRGGTLLQHSRVLVATVAHQENPYLCLQVLHAARFHVFRGAYILLRVLSDTKSQEVPGRLEEIRRQSSVPILSGPVIVITNIATACAFSVKRWSTEFVSRAVRTAQDDQEGQTEQSLSESLQTRRQISKIHENMGLPSSRTLVPVLRLGGAKHRCGACEAQERPAGPIVSRSPTSFVFNDVVGLDLFFLNVYGNKVVAVMRKASCPCCRPAAQPVLGTF